jgi:hypothetical protein
VGAFPVESKKSAQQTNAKGEQFTREFSPKTTQHCDVAAV